MGIRPHIHLICGTDTFPVTADGEPIISPIWDGNYPCYSPPAGVESITEWSYWTHIPLPECPDLTETDMYAMSHQELMEAGNRRFLRSVLERKTTKGALEADSIIFRGDNEYNENAGVIGYKVDELPYNSDMTWAWLSLHPDMMERRGGCLPLPTLSLEQADGPASDSLRFYLNLVRKRPGYKELTTTRKFWNTAEMSRFAFGREDEIRRKHAQLREINRKKREFRNGQVYPNFMAELPGWLDITMYLFNWIGFHVRRRDLRLLLVWTWG